MTAPTPQLRVPPPGHAEPGRQPLSRRRSAREGIALVLTLFFIVILTLLIVAFLSFMTLNRISTASYAKSIQAQEIARGGLQDILSDLRSEIIAGSTVYSANSSGTAYTNSYASAYIPTTSNTAQPARLGYPATDFTNQVSTTLLPSTLVRVSRAAQDGTPTDLYPTLNTTYYSNLAGVQGGAILNRASNANSSSSSANGRYVSAARWNKTYLLSATTLSAGSAGVIIPTDFSQTTTTPYGPPDWVYVCRTGSRVCQTSELSSLLPNANVTASYTISPGSNPPASPVVGRYAYVVYDEGALLDVNAAGFPVTATNAVAGMPPVYTNIVSSSPQVYMTQMILGKSNLSHADLTQVITASTGTATINSLVGMRSASYGSTVTSSGTTFLQAAYNYSQNGFLNFQTSSSNSVSDSPVVSRQDLINFMANADPVGKSIIGAQGFNTASPQASKALPYLGTFSRAVSAPTWMPTANTSSSNIYNYASNAEVSTGSPFTSSYPNPNRDMANVRFSVAATVTHYNDNATSATYTANVGDPLLQSRFSLAKIAWLSQVNPNLGVGATLPASYATPIQACFGLTWGVVGAANGGMPCWDYVGSPAGSGATAAAFNGTIETLDQVAAEGREPNFFELLKAAILSGSLGQNPGHAAFQNASIDNTGTQPFNMHTYLNGPTTEGVDGLYAYSFDEAGSYPAPCQVSDMQIMQIGANIIDQFDADSYPTAIYFNYAYNSGGTPTQLPAAYDAAASGNSSPPSLQFGATDMVYGDENIPEILGFFLPSCTGDGQPPPVPATSGPCGNYGVTAVGLGLWWQPELWNPHQAPNPASGGTTPPTTFVIKGYGSFDFTWGTVSSTGVGIGGFSQSQNLTNKQWITFTDSSATSGTNSAFYAHPRLLTQGDGATGSIPNVTINNTGNANQSANSEMEGWSGTIEGYTVAPNHFVGFWAGYDTTYPGTTTFCNVLSNANGQPNSFCMGWQDSTGGFHPYSFMSGLFVENYGVVNNTSGFGGTPAGSTDPSDISAQFFGVVDPRTERFSGVSSYSSGLSTGTGSEQIYADAGTFFPGAPNGSWFNDLETTTNSNIAMPNVTPPWGNPAFVYDTTAEPYPEGGYEEFSWLVNSTNPVSTVYSGSNHSPYKTYYTDPDGVVRPGDGLFSNAATGDGIMSFETAGTSGGSPYPSGDTTTATSTASYSDTSGISFHGRRPVILNRPFRNVGELGYTFRDEPFKTLDFFSTASADAALLDVFSITDEAKIVTNPATSNGMVNNVVAGEVNINNAMLPVIEALLSAGSKKDFDTTYNMTSTDTADVAAAIVKQLNPGGSAPSPILNRAGLVTVLGANPATGSVNGAYANFPHAQDNANKAYLEGPVRALSDVTNTRTWNLMIDIIAQSGHMSPSAASLNDFIVEGEKRYWLHIAIDRYTGKIVDQQLEPVYE